MAKYAFGKPKSSKFKLKKSMLSKLSAFKDVNKMDDGFYYMDANNEPFVLGGLIKPENNCGEYYRLDASKKEVYSGANRGLAECTAGGTIRFATDAMRFPSAFIFVPLALECTILPTAACMVSTFTSERAQIVNT